jgi:Flp pilus assembly pilin Flp
VLLIAVVLMAVVTVTLFKFLRAAWRRLSVFLSGSPKAV